MNETQRSQVRDNVKYLQQVRPIDPEEIYEYVEGQPHPAAVRQILREEATDLELIEREDGRFEPASEEAIEIRFSDVKQLPEPLARRLQDLLVEEFGPGWPNGTAGDRLRAAIRDFKERYLRGEPVTYDRPTALGYAIYHFPSYFATIQYVLAELAGDKLVPGRLRVLDVGAGVGGPALGLDHLLPADALVEYHAVEPSAAGDVLDAMLDETGRNFHSTIHTESIESFDPTGTYDLILCANVLSELDDPVAVLSDLIGVLADGGTILATAPADRNTATQLREIERGIETETNATIYAPTVRLWPGERSTSESWSFDRKPDLKVPAFQQRLDEGSRSSDQDTAVASTAETRSPGDGEFVNVDVQYAYSLLRTDGKKAINFQPERERMAKMGEMERHVTDRIDCVGIKLSHDLAESENSLFLVGDGSQQIDHFAVLTEQSALNRDLEAADYGELLRFENVLVLWNDDKGAYNLVVDGETVVDRLPSSLS